MIARFGELSVQFSEAFAVEAIAKTVDWEGHWELSPEGSGIIRVQCLPEEHPLHAPRAISVVFEVGQPLPQEALALLEKTKAHRVWEGELL